MIAVAFEAISHIGKFNIDLTLVENVVRKNIVLTIVGAGFQLDTRHTLVKETTVDQKVAAIDEFDAFARIIVAERAMLDDHMATGGGIHGCQGTHHADIGKPQRIRFIYILQLHTRPVMRELVTKQINRVVALSIKQKLSAIHAQIR